MQLRTYFLFALCATAFGFQYILYQYSYHYPYFCTLLYITLLYAQQESDLVCDAIIV